MKHDLTFISNNIFIFHWNFCQHSTAPSRLYFQRVSAFKYFISQWKFQIIFSNYHNKFKVERYCFNIIKMEAIFYSARYHLFFNKIIKEKLCANTQWNPQKFSVLNFFAYKYMW